MNLHILSRRELEFLLYEWLNIQQINDNPRFNLHNRETFDAALDICEHIARDLFLQSKTVSQARTEHQTDEAAQIKAAVRAFADAGMIAASQEFALGGMQLPLTIQAAGLSYLLAANYRYAIYPLLTLATANTVLRSANPQQIERYGKALISGKVLGTLALSELDDGSNLAGVQCRAYLQADGSYHLHGEKNWVMAAGHDYSENIFYLILARIVGQDGKVIAGNAGVSLFLVPEYLEQPGGLESNQLQHQPLALNAGLAAEVYSNLILGQANGEGATGYLLGSAHRGLVHIFATLNEIRLALGLASSALAYRSYRSCLQLLNDDAASLSQPKFRSALLASKTYAEAAMALSLYCASLLDQERYAESHERRQQARLLSELLLPVAKAWSAQAAQKVTEWSESLVGLKIYQQDLVLMDLHQAIQLNKLQQGGTENQAHDLLLRKIPMADGAALELLGLEIHKTMSQASKLPQFAGYAKELARVMQKLALLTQQLNQEQERQRALSLAPAYLECFGDTMVAWLWLDQVLHCHQQAGAEDAEFYHGKLQACRYYYRWQLPLTHGKLEPLLSLDNSIFEMQPEWF